MNKGGELIPTSYSAGEASLRIVPDARRFIADLEEDLKRRRAEFTVQVGADTSQAEEKITRAKEQAKKPVATQLDIDLRDAENRLRALRIREEAKKLKLTVDIDADPKRAELQLKLLRTQAEARAIELRLKVNVDDIKNQISKGLSDAGTSLGGALKTSGIFALVGELPAAATAITNVAGAIQQLAGAGAVLPGVFAGVIADVGTAKLAIMGVGDAFKAVDKAADGSAKNIAAANEALAKLAPSAQDFVKSVESLKPAFEGLQKDVQGKFFTGLGDEIKTLARADLPILQKGLGGIATAFNQNLKQLGGSLSSGSTQNLLDRILGNTGDAQARLSKTIDPLIHAFGTLAAAGSDTLPRLADGVGKLADRFDHFISAANDDGRLTGWIDKGIEGFDHLGNTLLNIGKIVTDLTGAAGGDGGLLKWLDEGSSKLQTFLSSTQGQETLRKFFAEGREEIKQLVPILENLGPIAAGAFSAARDAAGIWLPVLKDVTDTLARNPDLVRAIADAFLAWKFVSVINDVSTAVKGLSTALGLIGPAAATAGTTGAAGLAPLLALAPELAAIAATLGLVVAIDQHPERIPNAVAQGGRAQANRFGVNVNDLPNNGSGPGGTAPPPPPAATSDLPPAVRPSPPTAPGYIPIPGAPVSQLPGAAPGAPQATQPGPIGPVPQNPLLLPYGPPRAAGGPTPSGRGPGPTGGWPSEIHSDEWILPAHARTAVGDKALWALTSGRSFAPGGYIDQFGNPITPGPAPGGPGPVAPAPGGGGLQAAAGSFLSGIGGPIGNIAGLIQGASGGSSGSGSRLTPGFAGLAQAGNNPDLLNQWGTQTGDWLGNFGAKTLTSFGSALWQGALGFFGLQNSILSPNNPYFQDASQTAGFFLGQNGPLGGGSSSSSGDSSASTTDDTQHLTADRVNTPKPLKNTPIAPNAKPGGKPVGGNQGIVYQAMINAGYGPDQWSSLQSLLNGESGFRNTAQNPSSTAYGMFQFLDSTWAGVGGSKTSDPGLQSQYGLAYIKQRYGTPSAAWAAWQSRSPHWYQTGGGVHQTIDVIHGGGWWDPRYAEQMRKAGTGDLLPPAMPKMGTDTVPAMLTPGEHVLTTDDVNALGGQAAVYAFRRGLHRAGGGGIMPLGSSGGGSDFKGPGVGDIGKRIDSPLKPQNPIWGDWGPGTILGPRYGPSGTGKPVDLIFPWWMFPGDKESPGTPGRPNWKDRIGPQGFAPGGEVTTGLPVDPYKPFPRPPDARQLIPQPVAPPSPSVIGPPALQPPVAAAGPPEPVAAAPRQQAPVGGPAPTASAPSSYDHNLPAVNTAIESTASTLGNIAQTAAAVGTFGIAGGLGGALAGGGGGPSIAGLFQQAGKIAKNLVNVGSSFLVGNITPGTSPGGAYGDTLRPQQKVPQTAPWDSSRTYIFHGVDSRNIVDDLRTKDAQDSQATLARYGVTG